MEVVVSFLAIVLTFTFGCWMYELWFIKEQRRNDARNNRNANYDFDRARKFEDEIFSDLI